MTDSNHELLDQLLEHEVVDPLDYHFALTLERMSPGQTEAVMLGAALTSRAVTHGHVCLDLERTFERPLLDANGEVVDIRLPSWFEWVLQFSGSTLVSDGSRPTPLVFDGKARVYLSRYFAYQQRLAAALRARATSFPEAETTDEELDELGRDIERLFAPTAETTADPRQKLAALVAALRGLTVISGGPGTGKTTTVVRILALLASRALRAGRPAPRIRLLAPTGKAAARLVESIARSRAQLDCSPEVAAAIPAEASTIHRALGYRPSTPTRFTHDQQNPLPVDIVLVDEASMVDLALMTKLVDAIAPHARIILLGDADQLASVEAGAILGDICNAGSTGHRYSVAFRAKIERALGAEAGAIVAEASAACPEAPGIWDCIVHLTQSFRFGSDSAIGRLARAFGRADSAEVLELLRDRDAIETEGRTELRGETSMVELHDPMQLVAVIRNDVLSSFRPMLKAGDPATKLELLGGYRLLSAHRRGPFGTERLNRLIEQILSTAELIEPGSPWYEGRPIIITRNDYQLELYNGDVGVLARDERGELMAWFPAAPDPQGDPRSTKLRAFAPARLPPHESVWSMTVHKSQGSEFDHVGLLVPPAVSPILTRELLYTGITRARRTVKLYGSPAIVAQAIKRGVDRASGLRDALWG